MTSLELIYTESLFLCAVRHIIASSTGVRRELDFGRWTTSICGSYLVGRRQHTEVVNEATGDDCDGSVGWLCGGGLPDRLDRRCVRRQRKCRVDRRSRARVGNTFFGGKIRTLCVWMWI